jgi:AraC-like DNA-binding protein
MITVTYSPPPSLAKYVAYFWSLQCPYGDTHDITMFANEVSGILFQHHNGRTALKRTTGGQAATGADLPHAFVYGRRTSPGSLIARGPFELTGAVFRSQGLPGLLRLNPGDFSSGPIAVDDLFADGLRERLLNARSTQRRLSILARFLRSRVDDALPADPVVSESLQLLRQQVRTIRIPRLLAHLRMSERQLERRFKSAVGVSPHQYFRILRLQEAVHLLRTQQFVTMAALASELNYADQSHFIKDVKELSGYVPTALMKTIGNCVDLPCASILAPEHPRLLARYPQPPHLVLAASR